MPSPTRYLPRRLPDAIVRPRRRSPVGEERGATLAEYALILALVVGVTVVAVNGLTETSGDYLSTTGDDIGEPRERIADMDDDLPDPPAWLP